MNRYAAFLRGMNLGGRRITNDDLRSHFEALGCEDVATFRASGNVIFAREGKPAVLTAELEAGLAEALGYEVPVFLRSAKELAAIAAHEPFDAKPVAASKGKLQVVLLTKKPSAAAARTALALATDDDQLAIERRELYWLPRLEDLATAEPVDGASLQLEMHREGEQDRGNQDDRRRAEEKHGDSHQS